MKRKFLREQGLSEEQVEAVMAKYGEKRKEYLDQIEKLENGTENLEAVMAERDELKKEVEKVPELVKQLDELKHDLEGRDMKYAIERVLDGKTYDLPVVMSMLDTSKLVLTEDGNVEGLNEQVALVKEKKHYLFKEDSKNEAEESVNPQFTPGGNPKIEKNEESLLDAKLKAYKERFGKGE